MLNTNTAEILNSKSFSCILALSGLIAKAGSLFQHLTPHKGVVFNDGSFAMSSQIRYLDPAHPALAMPI